MLKSTFIWTITSSPFLYLVELAWCRDNEANDALGKWPLSSFVLSQSHRIFVYLLRHGRPRGSMTQLLIYQVCSSKTASVSKLGGLGQLKLSKEISVLLTRQGQNIRFIVLVAGLANQETSCLPFLKAGISPSSSHLWLKRALRTEWGLEMQVAMNHKGHSD